MRRETRSNAGFTLVELLVVIAVIALLAALLLPALSRSKAAAKRTYRQNNLRQLVTALNLYADDSGFYPPCSRGIRGSTTDVSLWNAYLLPFAANNRDLFYCPSFPDSFRWTTNATANGYCFPTNIQGNRPFCYALNAKGAAPANYGIAQFTSLTDEMGRKPMDIRAPSDMIAIGDDTNHTTNNPSGGCKTGNWGEFIATYDHLSDREWVIGTVHNQGGNMVFLDNHVEWAKWPKWIELSDTAARRWNYDNAPHEEFW